MFKECQDIDYSKLNTKYCYSFVMKHVDIRNISVVFENRLFLVEVYNLENLERLPISEYPSNIESINNLFIHHINTIENLNDNFNIKGFTIKKGNKRYKIINPSFKKVKDLKINLSDKDLIQYIELRKNGNLKEYLNYY